MSSFIFSGISRYLRRRKREQRLQTAAAWPVIPAKLLSSKLVLKDDLAEGSAAQDSQVECPYYFTLNDGYYGGHVRSVACSDSEGRRIQRQVEEGMSVKVRYNPANPDQTCVLQADNEGTLPFRVLPG